MSKKSPIETSDFELDLRAMNVALLLISSSGCFSSQQSVLGDTASPQTLLAQLQHAASLYRGDFLDGFSAPFVQHVTSIKDVANFYLSESQFLIRAFIPSEIGHGGVANLEISS